MPLDYYLYRGSEKIALQKEPEFFTAVLPRRQMVEEASQMPGVQEMDKVFHNIYKIRTRSFERDGLMAQMRKR